MLSLIIYNMKSCTDDFSQPLNTTKDLRMTLNITFNPQETQNEL